MSSFMQYHVAGAPPRHAHVYYVLTHQLNHDALGVKLVMHTRFAQTCTLFAHDVAIPVHFFVRALLCDPHIVHNQGVHRLHISFPHYTAIMICMCLFVCPVIL